MYKRNLCMWIHGKVAIPWKLNQLLHDVLGDNPNTGDIILFWTIKNLSLSEELPQSKNYMTGDSQQGCNKELNKILKIAGAQECQSSLSAAL